MKNSRVSTGIEGLDEIMQGGLIPRRAYLVRLGMRRALGGLRI